MLCRRNYSTLGAILFVLAITLASANLAVAAQKEKVLYRFDFKNGADPNADLIQDPQGNLYGVTNGGGQQGSGCAFNAGCGIVFELSPSAEGGWTYSVLYAFKGGTDSANPSGRLIFDTKGNLYGAAETGGVSGLGTIFELTRGSDGSWTENIVHSFPSSANDGFTPAGDLAFDANGNLYGSTLQGVGDAGNGSIYELSPQKNGSWTETPIYFFDHDGKDGSADYGGVVLDKQGNIYGSTFIGNTILHSKGTVFEISPNSHGGWNERIIHNFLGSQDGGAPRSPLTFDPAGNLYGSTIAGGSNGGGTIFELSPASSGKWKEKRIQNFIFGGPIGPPPRVVFDSQGNILGTSLGGVYGAGVVWELVSQPEGGWKGKVFYNFQNGSDGSRPAGLVIGNDGHLYGPTQSGGGRYGYGTLFEVIP